MTLHVDESSLRVRITHEGVEWETLEDFRPHFYQEERVFYFDEAENITYQVDAENQREKHEKEDYFLYALLNGGIPYLRREAAYPNIDGSFEVKSTVTEEEHLARCNLVSDFHEKVAFSKMTDFRLLSPDGLKQQSVFDESWVVSIDLKQGSYHLESLDHE